MIALALVGLALAGTSDKACPAPVTAAELQQSLQEAETAYSRLDVEAFSDAMDQASFQVPCLAEAVDTGLVARVHRMEGLRQYVALSEERAVQAFAAARAADPTYVIPTWLVPDGHELRQLYGQMPLQNGEIEEVPAPLAGGLRFDGQAASARPARWPTLVQVLDPDGRTVASAYLFPGDALPPYLAAPSAERPASSPGARAPRLVLLGSSVALAVGAGVTWGLAGAAERSFDDPHPEWGLAELEAQRAQTNTLATGSALLGLAALGTGAVAVFAFAW